MLPESSEDDKRPRVKVVRKVFDGSGDGPMLKRACGSLLPLIKGFMERLVEPIRSGPRGEVHLWDYRMSHILDDI